jgi:opacity protein-like surface antigen
MSLFFRLLLIALFLVGNLQPAVAQGIRPTFYVGGGPTFPHNRLADFLDNGYNVQAGAGVRVGRGIELLGEFDFNHMAVTSSALQRLAAPDGNARIYSITGNIKYNVIPLGPVKVYAIGGGGWYRRTVEFTQPTIALVTVFDPFFGFYPVAVPANQVIGSISRNGGGFNIGAGVEFRILVAGVYIESRWHRAYTSPTNTTMTPLTIGIRF